jgi:hypothetical protein
MGGGRTGAAGADAAPLVAGLVNAFGVNGVGVVADATWFGTNVAPQVRGMVISDSPLGAQSPVNRRNV